MTIVGYVTRYSRQLLPLESDDRSLSMGKSHCVPVEVTQKYETDVTQT